MNQPTTYAQIKENIEGRAEILLTRYRIEIMEPEGERNGDVLAWLLADLIDYCAERDISFDAALNKAREFVSEEE